MRSLHLIPTMLGGGAERQLCYLCEGLVALGHEPHVALVSHGPNSQRLAASGAVVHTLPGLRSANPAMFVAIRHIVRAVRPDVVQTWLPMMDTWGGLAARAAGVPWVYREPTNYRGDKRPSELVRRRVIDRASAIAANSETGAAYWRERLGTRTPVTVIPNAVPLEEFARATPLAHASLSLADNLRVVLFAGRFAGEKNIGLLTDTVTQLLRYRDDTAVVCCGEGPLLPRFRAAIASRGLSTRCAVLGYRSDVGALLKTADVFLATSEWEGRPNAVIEAMAAGCPIVLTDIPAHREVLDDRSAWFYPNYSSTEVLMALDRALDAAPAARAAHTDRALESVRMYSISRMARDYATLYESLSNA